MSILENMKPLIANSRLFTEANKLKKEKGKTRKGKHTRYAVKIGQGGTLDPLADGVLGITYSRFPRLLCDRMCFQLLVLVKVRRSWANFLIA